MLVTNAVSLVTSVCLSNALTRQFIFGMWTRLLNYQVMFMHKCYLVKIRVTGAKKVSMCPI